ncbi:hypothetical protein FRC11_006343 [Ceratobasidium sp. 423]|nr:hypothetical protein FRC11_006343 [Ceratobasidium sp. 423]
MPGDEDSAMSDNEEKCGPSEPVKAPGVFHAPTTQELVELREGSELFKSNSFKLQFELAHWKEHHNAIFVHGGGKYNMLADVPLESLELLRLDAQASLSLLDEASDEAFEAIFPQDLRNPSLRFDYSMSKIKERDSGQHPGMVFPTSALLSQLTSTIRKAPGTRVKACVVLQPAPTLRPLSQSTPNSVPFIELGLILDQTEAPRLVDYGPPADDVAGSEVFRAFWGPKSELRRFKDRRIVESVVWEFHFGIELEPVQRTVYDEVQIKSAEDLPLAVVTASPISPSLRGTSDFYPWPMDLARYSALPDSIKYIPPMDAILQLEKSARWPDDLAAIQKIKLAFFVGIADALRARDEKIRTAVAPDSDATETNIHDNCSLETLLDGIISDSNAAPGMVAAAQDALRIHETRFLHMPRHHAAVAALSHRCPSYVPTIRLVVRWLGVHMLLAHISHPLMELTKCMYTVILVSRTLWFSWYKVELGF